MGVLSFLSLITARDPRGFAHSETDADLGSSSSRFEDSVAFADLSRRRTDSQRLPRDGPPRQRWLLALLLIGSFTLGAVMFAAVGVLSWRTVGVFGALVTALCVSYLLVFRMGWHRKFREKHLKIPIVATALVIMLFLMYLEPVIQVLLAPFVFVSLAYGMYRIPRNSAFLMIALFLAGYAAVVTFHFVERGSPVLLRLELLHFVSLALSLPGFVYLTGNASLLHRILGKAGAKIRTIEADAERDALLGCYNRRYIVQALEEQKHVADEHSAPLCLAILDLDHFKHINDEMGHLGGDEVLRVFSRVALQSVRQEDIFGRYGGEEFLLIFPATSLLPALNICERLRAQIEAYAWPGNMQCRVTVSIGVTQYVEGESVLELFSRADTATYLAKEGGRNQVVVEEPVSPDDAGADAEAPSSTMRYENEDEALMLVEEAELIEKLGTQRG